MKILFVEGDEVLVVSPERITLQQISEGVSALGVIAPVPNEDPNAKPEVAFTPLISFPVNLVRPAPEEPVQPGSVVTTTEG